MAVILTVLKVLGIVVLVLLALLLILMLLVLFVPFRYSFSGGINDPEGDTKAFHLDPKKDISAEGSVRWLLGALNVTGGVGGEEGPGAARLEVRIFGRKYPIEKLLKKKEELREEEKEEKPKEPEEKKTLDEKIEEVLRRVEKLTRRVDDALRALQTEYGVRAKEVIIMRVLHMIEQVMPTQWGLTGVLGLGDPSRSAKVFAVQGYLYPLTAGHVAIGTDYELYRYDLRGAARGKIRIITFVYGGIRLLFSRDVRRLLRRLRRGPAPGHRYTNGNNKQAIAAGNVQERIK